MKNVILMMHTSVLPIWMEQRGRDKQKANSLLECRDKVPRIRKEEEI